MNFDEKIFFYMSEALKQAKIAMGNNEVPIGAIIVDENGEIIGRGYNQMQKVGCQSAHAEVLAIEDACKRRGDWRLDGCSIYVTLEPCLMCFGLIQLSRLKLVFFGAKSDLFGCGLDKAYDFPIYKRDLFIFGGLMKEESIHLLKDFFTERRKGKDKNMKQRLDFIKKMKEKLIKRRQELSALMAKTSQEGVGEKGQVKDSADEALTVNMERLQSSLEATEIDELKLIEEALHRIEKGEYGICTDCSEPINLKRLEIYPYASRCITCQENFEN